MNQHAATPLLHKGMPPLDSSGPPLSRFEFWPMWLFYGPMYVYILWLMLRYRGITLPLIANPSFPGGGLVGESKSTILALAQDAVPEKVAHFIALQNNGSGGRDQAAVALAQARAAGLDLPLVAKPDIGCRGAGVRSIRNIDQLAKYMTDFPVGETFLLQRCIDLDAEAGVFYVRKPGKKTGQIISLTLKYFPHVIGDGKSTVRQLILADARAGLLPHLYLPRHAARLDEILPVGTALRLAFAGSHSRGAIFRDGTALVTQAMTDAFDRIADALPGFHFGRFDIRFEDYRMLQQGDAFTILEVNGAGAESTHIWDRQMTLGGAYRALMKQYRLMFEIGFENRRRGVKMPGLAELRALYGREKRLVPLYPATE
jgi:hypothetical protein